MSILATLLYHTSANSIQQEVSQKRALSEKMILSIKKESLPEKGLFYESRD